MAGADAAGQGLTGESRWYIGRQRRTQWTLPLAISGYFPRSSTAIGRICRSCRAAKMRTHAEMSMIITDEKTTNSAW